MSFATAVSSGTQRSKIGKTDWTDPEQVGHCINAVYDGRTNPAKLRAEIKAHTNLCMYGGDQWFTWSKKQRQMVQDDRDLTGQWICPDWQKKLTFNKILQHAQMRLAKMIRQESAWDVVSPTDDVEDGERAQSSNGALKAYWQQILNMPIEALRAMCWLMCTGTGAWKLSWNRSLGHEATDNIQNWIPPQTGAAPQLGQPDPMQAAYQKFSELYGEEAAMAGQWAGKTGDIEVTWVPIFGLNAWPFNSTEWSHPQIYVHTFEETANQVAARLKMDVDDVRAMAQGSYDDDFYRNRTPRTRWQDDGAAAGVGYGGYDGENDGIRVHQGWHVPCDQYPNGRTCYVIGKTCVPETLTDIEYCDGMQRPRVPLFIAQDIYVPNSLWGHCMVDDLRDAQRDYNLAASQRANHRNMAIMPSIFRMQGDGLSDQAFVQAPGKVNEIPGPQFLPRVMERPDIGIDHDKALAFDANEMRELSGSGQVDYGGVSDGNPKSGRGILALQEQNDLRLVPSATQFDNCMALLGDCVLWTLQKYGADSRIIPLFGEDNSREIVKFRGIDLRPTTWGKPGQRVAMVRVEAYRNMPSTRFGSLQLAETAMSTGLMNPAKPDDAAALRRIIGLGNAQGFIDADRKHIAKQQSEIDKWRQAAQGPMPENPIGIDPVTQQPIFPEIVGPPAKSDNHQVHAKRIRDWMNTEDYEGVAVTRPDIAMEVGKHYDLHLRGQAYDLLRPQADLSFAIFTLWKEFQAKALETNQPEIAAFYASPLPMMQMLLGGGGAGQPQQQGPNKAQSDNGQQQPGQNGHGAEHPGQPQNSHAAGDSALDTHQQVN